MTVALRRSWAKDLDAATLYELLKLRVEVFVVEQACPYPELDGVDLLAETRHFWLENPDGEVISTSPESAASGAFAAAAGTGAAAGAATRGPPAGAPEAGAAAAGTTTTWDGGAAPPFWSFSLNPSRSSSKVTKFDLEMSSISSRSSFGSKEPPWPGQAITLQASSASRGT